MVDLRKNVASAFAKQTIGKAKESLGIESTENSHMQSENNGQGPIIWQNYNYPPLIRIIHYSTNHLR